MADYVLPALSRCTSDPSELVRSSLAAAPHSQGFGILVTAAALVLGDAQERAPDGRARAAPVAGHESVDVVVGERRGAGERAGGLALDRPHDEPHQGLDAAGVAVLHRQVQRRLSGRRLRAAGPSWAVTRRRSSRTAQTYVGCRQR